MFDEAFKCYQQYAQEPAEENREKFYKAFHKAIIAYARWRIPPSQGEQTLRATDLVVDAFFKLDREALMGRTFATPEDMRKYALIIIRNAHIDYARSKQRRLDHTDPRPLDDVKQENPQSQQAFDEAEFITLVDAAIEDLARLNPDAANIARYYVYGRHTPEEIAQILGIGERTVRNTITMLRVRLAATGIDFN